MPGLEKTYQVIASQKSRGRGNISSPALLLLTVVYLVCVLSIPLSQPQKIIWLAAYPIAASEMQGIGFGRIFLKSLWILPFVAFIGIFNPFADTATAFRIGGMEVSRGWVSFFSILLRGLLSFQAVLLLVDASGFIDICNSLRKLRCPAVLTSQLLLTYRYISVILGQAITMRRAREARGYGRRSYPLGMWGVFTGQLLIRSLQRARWIHRAMDARGFDGTLPTGAPMKWDARSCVYVIAWSAVIVCLRLTDFSNLINRFLQ